MPELPSGTVTLLFTDIQDSTRLTQSMGRRYPEVLAAHRALLRTAFWAHDGQEVDTQGDSFFVVFPRASQAVDAAVAAQRALAAHPWPEDGTVRVRMGLHTGEPLQTGEGYTGIDVVRGARIAAAGHGGQILLSEATADLVQQGLPLGLSLRDLGVHRLKGLTQPERVFQIIIPGLPDDFPPLTSLCYRANNLPGQLTDCIGREREGAAIGELLRDDGVRLVTLTGPGGAGKTRLSLQAAADLLADFPDGVWFIPLAPISTPDLVVSAVAQTLGVRESGQTSLMETLKLALAERRTLVLLDNFEQVVEAAPLVATLLAGCPRLKVLVTSRVLLRLSGEHTFPVPPLDLPEASLLPPLETLAQAAAVQLFIERARAVQPRFALTAENATAVVEICRRLDGLPLAIELAAARIRLLTAPELLSRLERRLPLLTGGGRDSPERQRTLRAALDWSFALLPEMQRQFLGQLSVFVGGWTLEAAEAVGRASGLGSRVSEPEHGTAATNPIAEGRLESPGPAWGRSTIPVAPDTRAPIPDAPGILDLLTDLIDHSLVHESQRDGETRFGLLETVREYAAERLAASGAERETYKRHASWFLEMTEQAWQQLRGPQATTWLARLDVDLDNLRAAIAWSLGDADNSGVTALGIAANLNLFWDMRGRFREGLRLLEAALARSDGVGSSWRARGLCTAGHLAVRTGDLARSRGLLEQSLAVARANGDRIVEAVSLSYLANAAENQGDYAWAHTLQQEALAIHQAIGNRAGIASVTYNLGNAARQVGNIAASEAMLEEAVGLYRELGDVANLAVALVSLAQSARLNQNLGRSRTALAESLHLCREHGIVPYRMGGIRTAVLIAEAEEDHVPAARLSGALDALLTAHGRALDGIRDRTLYQ
ncbi:MAG: ATP-binding protein, partial [Dehalococcoidia bacterium]